MFNNTRRVVYNMSVDHGSTPVLHEKLDFNPEITELLQEIDISEIDDWTLSATKPSSDYGQFYKSDEFFVNYTGDGESWNNYAAYMKVEYTSNYYAVYNIDESRYSIRKYDRKENEEKYVISGPLVDPIVTSSISKMVYYISKQISEINYKIDFQKDIENCYALFTRRERQKEFNAHDEEPIFEINTDFDKNTFTSPIHQSGIGETSIERTAKIYTIY